MLLYSSLVRRRPICSGERPIRNHFPTLSFRDTNAYLWFFFFFFFASITILVKTQAPPRQNFEVFSRRGNERGFWSCYQMKILAPVAVASAIGAAYTSTKAMSHNVAFPIEFTWPRCFTCTTISQDPNSRLICV